MPLSGVNQPGCRELRSRQGTLDLREIGEMDFDRVRRGDGELFGLFARQLPGRGSDLGRRAGEHDGEPGRRFPPDYL